VKQKPLRGVGQVVPEELLALAASVRELIDRMLRIEGAGEALGRARRQVDAAAEELSPHARPEGPPRLGAGPGDARPYYVEGVMLPRYLPQSPEYEISTEDGVTRGTVLFRVCFEGPPGCVHGGHVASFFDQILGHHNLELGRPAMTASLSVRYRRPTPLFTRLDFEVRTLRSEGRKVVTAGTLGSEGRVFAEGEGLFVLPDAAPRRPRAAP
jgi:acyl-coenzyme A thioesterase PaaI-like protein